MCIPLQSLTGAKANDNAKQAAPPPVVPVPAAPTPRPVSVGSRASIQPQLLGTGSASKDVEALKVRKTKVDDAIDDQAY